MPDQVNCEHLAEESALLERVYELGGLPRLKDLLSGPQGTVSARFSFARLGPGRLGAEVRVTATPSLVCQRCMQVFDLRVAGGSEIEFTSSEAPQGAESEREFFKMQNGLVSLRELAEEELLLALPLAPMCDTPLTCGNARYAAGGEARDPAGEMRRPFSALQDLLKKT